MDKLQTLKGFRDFLPEDARKRQSVITTLKLVFEANGFEPLETPALEYEEILLGKYGDEGDKLLYRFVDNGKRKVALRYDQTVPTARVVAQYANTLTMPFMRYQVQPVWRAENTQKGRFREFLQCDADIIGSASPLADALVIATAAQAIEKLGFTNFKVIINDRTVFANLPTAAIIAIDKLKKIGEEGVCQELVSKGAAKDLEDAKSILSSVQNAKMPEQLSGVFSSLEDLGIKRENYVFDPTLARGLDYYTATIFEIEIEGYTAGSVCGGGRYDKLIGMFAGKDIPATGFAFGFDRLMEAVETFQLFPQTTTTTKTLVTIFSKDQAKESLKTVAYLRQQGIFTELYPDTETALEKQLKYANQKGIPYTVIIGPDEAAKKMVTLRNMVTREQESLTVEQLIEKLR